jgi:hypothetical protein
MPRLRQRPRAMRESLDSPRVRCRLITAQDFCIFDGPEPDEYDLQTAWAELGPELMRLWLSGAEIVIDGDHQTSEHGEPGTRPAAWWLFDAPGRRRVVSGTERPSDDDRTYFGVPKIARGLVKYESETEFLERHGLLTEAERIALETSEQPTT